MKHKTIGVTIVLICAGLFTCAALLRGPPPKPVGFSTFDTDIRELAAAENCRVVSTVPGPIDRSLLLRKHPLVNEPEFSQARIIGQNGTLTYFIMGARQAVIEVKCGIWNNEVHAVAVRSNASSEKEKARFAKLIRDRWPTLRLRE